METFLFIDVEVADEVVLFSCAKFKYVRSLGVEPIDRNAPDLVERVRALTGGEGVDVAYDGVCSKDSIQKNLPATCNKIYCRKGHRIWCYGEVAADGSGLQKSVEDIFAERLQPRVTFWALDTEFYKKTEVAEFYAIVNKVRSRMLN